MAAPDPNTIALLPAPPGYVVDFDNPQRRGVPGCYWVTGVGLVLSTALFAMRTFTKARIVRDFKIEDWCVVGAYIFSVAVQGILIQAWASKAGTVHIWEESITKFNYFLVLVIASAILYVPCLGLAKFSLLLFYYRMSKLRWLRIVSVIISVIVIGYSISTIFALIFPCKPVHKAWDATVIEGSCINRGAVYIVQAVTNIVTDVFLLLIPIPIVWKLNMPRVQKIGLFFIFVIGSLTCVTSVVRLVLLLPSLETTDQPWAVAIPSIWIGIEANLAIICCSLPALRLFIRHFAPRLIGEYSLGRSKQSNYGEYTGGSNTRGSKYQEKLRTRSTYGKMGYSDASTDVELQAHHGKFWAECRRGSETEEKLARDNMHVNTSHLEDPTPPGTAYDYHPGGIVVTKTFG